MALASAQIQRYPTPDEVLQTLLAAVAFAYERVGLDVNVAEGSELFFRYRALSQFVSVAITNGRLGLRDIDPRNATGQALIDWAAVFGVFPRPASAAIGPVAVETVQLSGGATPTFDSGVLPLGRRCTSPTGIEYEVTADTFVTNGSAVEIRAIDAGTAGNADENTPFQWNDASLSFLKADCIVGVGGIVDGEEADDEEDLRRNLIRRLANPAGGGNPAQVQQVALNSSAAIRDAFTYPAVQGPASEDVVLVSDSGDRTIGQATIDDAAAALLGEMPGSIKYNVGTVNPQGVDVIIDIAAPLPKAQGGDDGGFRDAVPWPSNNEPTIRGLITDKFVSPPSIETNSTSADPPKPGDRFGIWDPAFVNQGEDEQGNDIAGKLGIMREFTIQSVTGVSGAYIIQLDVADSTAIDFVTVNESYCSVGMEKLVTYARQFMIAMYGLGPGEKTDNPDTLPFGRRNPGPGIQLPIALTSLLLNAIAAADNGADALTNPEVLDLQYAARLAATTTTTLTTPSLPSSVASPPRILTLANLAFRRLVL